MTEPLEPKAHIGRRNPQQDEARARELFELERHFRRAQRRLVAETLFGCVMCCGVGLLLVSWAVHTTDARWGGIAFWCGLLAGDLGMVAVLMRHFRQGEDF